MTIGQMKQRALEQDAAAKLIETAEHFADLKKDDEMLAELDSESPERTDEAYGEDFEGDFE